MALPATEIKIKIMRKGDTLAGLAREWQERHPELVITEQVLSRVIHRRAPYVYPEVRQLLADYLGVRVAQIGREAQPRRAIAEPAEAAA